MLPGKPDQPPVEVPASVVKVVADALGHVQRGEHLRVIADDEEITTQQAADLLDVSRPYLVGLVDRGEIPSGKVGARRRLKLADVLLYRSTMAARSSRLHREEPQMALVAGGGEHLRQGAPEAENLMLMLSAPARCAANGRGDGAARARPRGGVDRCGRSGAAPSRRRERSGLWGGNERVGGCRRGFARSVDAGTGGAN